MSATSIWGGAIWWKLTRYRQVWCNLQLKTVIRTWTPWMWGTTIKVLYKSTFFTFLLPLIVCYDSLIPLYEVQVTGFLSRVSTLTSMRLSDRCTVELYHASHLWYPPFYTSPMASSALQRWTAIPTKEGCHWQAGRENRQTWQLANAAWYT